MDEQDLSATEALDTDDTVDTVAPTSFPLVAIGASAGGVKALQRLFECLPDDTGAAFVVIIHLDPERESGLAHILSTRTRMPVEQVDGRTDLIPNCVYVIPPNRRLQVTDREIATFAFDEPRGHRAPIDLFFRSLADQHGDGFAVVLSGAGSDGTIGVKAVKAAGGIILVQDPQEAEYASMPRSAIGTGVADMVLPIRDLADQLVQLIGNKVRLGALGSPEGENEIVRRILAYLRARSGHDFSKYKRSTVVRRLTRRMHLARRNNLEDYYQFLRDTADEVQRLFGDLLISVTTFFRDPDAFRALAEEIVPRLFKDKDSDDSLRVWIPGCATGEEAYSVVILLLEEASRREIRPDIQIFASDLDGGALAAARDARYPAAIEADVSEERLRRFFHREGHYYRVRREVRDLALFATHSLLKDPPFSRLDLISCRNLLIYLDRDLQQQALGTFNYALKPNGFLFLGSSENADAPPGLFRAVDRNARIYESLGRSGEHPVLSRTVLMPRLPEWQGPRSQSRSVQNESNLHRRALEELAPPSVLVDEAHNVVHISESAGRFMQHSAGRLKSDLAELVRAEMRVDLRLALDRAFEQGQASLSLPIPVWFNDKPQRVYLQVRPVTRQEVPRAALVMFIEGGPTDTITESRPVAEEGTVVEETVHELREQLQAVRDRLKTSREEEEAANEELRAANEELQSINEEYRSTAEELETSKEELQSINEELQTLNNELKLKLEGVSRAHNDLQNLMAATDVGTLFLDAMLRIKRFTPRVADLFNVTENDQGRPITDFTHRLDYEGLPDDARMVLQNLIPIEREVQSSDGSWFLMRLRPYRTTDDKIEGVVVTFVDVTERRRAEKSLRINERRLQLAREASDLGIVDYNPATGECWLDGRAQDLWAFTDQETVSMDLFWSRLHPDDLAQARAAFSIALSPGSDGLYAAEFRVGTDEDKERWVRGNGKVFFSDEKRIDRLVVTVQDVSDRKAWETRQRLLLSELSHRVKNTLAVVQSMARQTFRGTDDYRQALSTFEGRLDALSLAHDLLVKSDWHGAELEALVRKQLGAQLFENEGLVKLDGPPIMLPASLATPFGLLLHELGTNAIKYGALSKPAGTVALTWRLLPQEDGQLLEVQWREQGGPPPNGDIQPGFGSYLIQHGLPGAKVERQFPSEGLRCNIELPLNGTEL
jgi:two-component system, chemotaxis family, CheB/CheR fusion protein